MKKITLLLSILLFSSLSYAGSYVCYDSKTITRDANGREQVQYYGCYKSRSSCRGNSSKHFGRYPSSRAQRRAFKRCRSNTPKFIDKDNADNIHANTTTRPTQVQSTTKQTTNSNLTNRLLGLSVARRPINIEFYGPPTSNPTLIIGGIHGNEKTALQLMTAFRKSLKRGKLKKGCSVAVIPVSNPDGVALNTRTNQNRVDLNRNFDTKNWSNRAAKRRHNPGSTPGSEPETQILMKIIDDLKPARIVVLHSPLKVINYDGPAQRLAMAMRRHIRYRVTGSIGYPTPGSLGNYAGVERNIPTITFEMPLTANSRVIRKGIKALYAAIEFGGCR